MCPALRPSNREHVDFRPVERLWVRDLAAHEHIEHALHAGHRIQQHASDGDRARLWARLPLLPGRLRLSPGTRAAAGSAAGARRNRPSQHGHSKIGLVSAAVSDHTQIDELAIELQRMGARSAPASMRMDPISVPLIRAMAETGARKPDRRAGGRQPASAQRHQQDPDRRADDARDVAGPGAEFPATQALFYGRPPTETDEDIQALIDFTHDGAVAFQAAHRHQRHALCAQGAHALPVGRHGPDQDDPQPPAHHPQGAGPAQRRRARRFARLGRGAGRAQPRRPAHRRCAAGDSTRPAHRAQLLPDHGGAAVWTASTTPASGRSGAPLPWDVVESGVSENYFHYELKLAARSETGLSCPPDSRRLSQLPGLRSPSGPSASATTTQRPIPAAKGGPWRAEDWRRGRG